MKQNLVVILGPTASGKTSLAVKLAKKINGEIISADSRQIYKGMDIGTGKDLLEYNINGEKIPYHLIDILNPEQDYSVYQFQKDFFMCYDMINKKNKHPILCGGTGLYIESILLNYNIPNISPNFNLRENLSEETKQTLIKRMSILNKGAYDKTYHTTKRRLIRAIEILVEPQHKNKKNAVVNDYVVLGIKIERAHLLKKIKTRINQRFNEGMIEEVETLITKGVNLERLKYFGLEYKIIGEYLFNKILFDDMKNKLNYAINKFSKRQMTFFRRMEKRGIKINWIEPNKITSINQILNKLI